MSEYHSRDIEKLTGASKRKVQYLVDMGIIIPKERGRGKPIIYTERNLIEVMMTLIFQEKRLSNIVISSVFEQLRKAEKKKSMDCADFFTNDEWGTRKDLLFAHATVVVGEGPTVVGGGREQFVTDRVGINYTIPDAIMDRVIRPAIGPITLIPLGKVKNQALKRLNM